MGAAASTRPVIHVVVVIVTRTQAAQGGATRHSHDVSVRRHCHLDVTFAGFVDISLLLLGGIAFCWEKPKETIIDQVCFIDYNRLVFVNMEKIVCVIILVIIN